MIMRKYNNCLAGIFMGLFTLLAIHSCLDDDDWANSFEDTLLGMGTVQTLDEGDYYFLLDEGSKLYPSDRSEVRNYEAKDGQRAFVYFDELPEELPGYEYNAKVRFIQDILTKDIYRMSPDKADSIGDDRIDVDNVWLTKDHVNIVYKFYHSNDVDKKHMLNLVIDEGQDAPDDGYLHLSFRHNAYNDTPLRGGSGIVSFKLDNVRDQLGSCQGLRIAVNTLYGGAKEFTVDKPAD